MAEILKAIGHPIRLEIINQLDHGREMSVADLQEHLEVEQSLLSHHLTKMKDKGLLYSKREGRNVIYGLALSEITRIFHCMESCDLI